MKTELEVRIAELEEELGRLAPGSDSYEHVASDHATLVKSLNDIRKTEAEISAKHRALELEEEKNENARLEAEKRTEIERKSKSLKTEGFKIALGTLLPMGIYMAWEHSGHIWAGKALNWIRKPK